MTASITASGSDSFNALLGGIVLHIYEGETVAADVSMTPDVAVEIIADLATQLAGDDRYRRLAETVMELLDEAAS